MAHLPKALQAKFKIGSPWKINLNDTFILDGKKYKYIGSNDSGKIIALEV